MCKLLKDVNIPKDAEINEFDLDEVEASWDTSNNSITLHIDPYKVTLSYGKIESILDHVVELSGDIKELNKKLKSIG